MARAHLLIIDDLGMRKLPHTAAENLLELIMRRYERASTMLTSNRPVDEWGKLLGDTAAVTALLDRLLHHAHVLKCGPRSWRTRVRTTLVVPHPAARRTRACMKQGYRVERDAGTEVGFLYGVESPFVSWTGSPASTPHCETGSSGERVL